MKRRIKFIRVGRRVTASTSGWLPDRESHIEHGSLVHFCSQDARSWIGVFVGHLLIG